LAQNHFDDPRVSQSELYSEVSWVNRRREPICTTRMVAMPDELTNFESTANLIPEAGQSVATSQQKAIERLAQEIVATMESPW
jgi:hypothetical protein